MELSENLKPKDLKYLIDTYVSIDQYTSKLDSDNITIAFYCNEKEAADDLLDFIEKMYFTEIRDIEVSDTLTEDNQYILYVEFERNEMFPEIVIDIINSVSYLTDNKKWSFETIDTEGSFELNEDNIRKYVRLEKYIEGENKEEVKEKVKESIQYSKDNLTRNYLFEGVVSEEEFNNIISKCESLNENTLDKEILEYNLPEKEIITADNKIFVIGDKIEMVSCLNEGNYNIFERKTLDRAGKHRKDFITSPEKEERIQDILSPREYSMFVDYYYNRLPKSEMMKKYGTNTSLYIGWIKNKIKNWESNDIMDRNAKSDMTNDEFIRHMTDDTNYEDYGDYGDLGELKRIISSALTTLSPREERVLRMNFGIGGKEYNLTEIGEMMGISNERVRQIREKAIRKLKYSDRSKKIKSYIRNKQ